MWLFARDETLDDAQRRGRQHYVYEDPADPRRREDLDDERERRAHARLRAFAWLFFGPSLAAAVVGLAIWVIHILKTSDALP